MDVGIHLWATALDWAIQMASQTAILEKMPDLHLLPQQPTHFSVIRQEGLIQLVPTVFMDILRVQLILLDRPIHFTDTFRDNYLPQELKTHFLAPVQAEPILPAMKMPPLEEW